jgi:hypothetical protein
MRRRSATAKSIRWVIWIDDTKPHEIEKAVIGNVVG